MKFLFYALYIMKINVMLDFPLHICIFFINPNQSEGRGRPKRLLVYFVLELFSNSSKFQEIW